MIVVHKCNSRKGNSGKPSSLQNSDFRFSQLVPSNILMPQYRISFRLLQIHENFSSHGHYEFVTTGFNIWQGFISTGFWINYLPVCTFPGVYTPRTTVLLIRLQKKIVSYFHIINANPDLWLLEMMIQKFEKSGY